ncbi:hypothetical protein [Evansella halocellulosilytica]|uniref:hypothetical protein n=1 Tax=Evansella halocellulosilytica TaxID=2011013 RepID=UPI001155FC62|nr:hypothetical protein [Evansella halocellulosilytica]
MYEIINDASSAWLGFARQDIDLAELIDRLNQMSLMEFLTTRHGALAEKGSETYGFVEAFEKGAL